MSVSGYVGSGRIQALKPLPLLQPGRPSPTEGLGKGTQIRLKGAGLRTRETGIERTLVRSVLSYPEGKREKALQKEKPLDFALPPWPTVSHGEVTIAHQAGRNLKGITT